MENEKHAESGLRISVISLNDVGVRGFGVQVGLQV